MPVFYPNKKLPETLPEVVLTTAIENGAVFTAEESAALSAAVALGKPVIVNCTIMESPSMAVIMHNYAGVGLVTIFAEMNFMLATVDESGLWVAMVTGIQEDALANISERLSTVEQSLQDMPTIISVASEDDLPDNADEGTIAIVEGE